MAEEHRYLEIVEQLSLEDLQDKQPAMMRIEVADEDEAREKYPDYEGLFSGKKYLVKYHVHRHGDCGLPCTVEILKSVE